MALQDDIHNLTSQIAEEQQSAEILDKQISDERQTSTQKIDDWQQQAHRHRDAATRMEQELQDKQRELAREEEQQAQEAHDKSERNEKIARGFF